MQKLGQLVERSSTTAIDHSQNTSTSGAVKDTDPQDPDGTQLSTTRTDGDAMSLTPNMTIWLNTQSVSISWRSTADKIQPMDQKGLVMIRNPPDNKQKKLPLAITNNITEKKLK